MTVSQTRSCQLLILCFILLLAPLLLDEVAGQRRYRRPQQRPPARATIDYSKFSHATPKHQGACNTCHKIPTTNWKKVSNFPDVADYPDHDACLSCHRPQFFRGAKPPICSVCHSKVSPRDDARFAFRNPASARQFLSEFPHDKHQNVIAQLNQGNEPANSDAKLSSVFITQTVDLRVWAHSRTVKPQTTSLQRKYNNCEICHAPQTTAPATPSSGWVDSLVPDAASFKTVPTTHASCFNCHWKAEQPVSENCAGCHKLTKPFFDRGTPERFSLKFRHAREQHVAECTTCHINITKAATLRGLKPDVPITSCTECHNKDGLRLDVSKELEALDRNREFTCSYCHTSEVGRRDAPNSHYLIAGRPPLQRKDIK